MTKPKRKTNKLQHFYILQKYFCPFCGCLELLQKVYQYEDYDIDAYVCGNCFKSIRIEDKGEIKDKSEVPSLKRCIKNV